MTRGRCEACSAPADTIVPVDDGDGDLWQCCFYCAHQIVSHPAKLEDAPSARCECKTEAIYPQEVYAAQPDGEGN